jgi:hypothetical protein
VGDGAEGLLKGAADDVDADLLITPDVPADLVENMRRR